MIKGSRVKGNYSGRLATVNHVHADGHVDLIWDDGQTEGHAHTDNLIEIGEQERVSPRDSDMGVNTAREPNVNRIVIVEVVQVKVSKNDNTHLFTMRGWLATCITCQRRHFSIGGRPDDAIAYADLHSCEQQLSEEETD